MFQAFLVNRPIKASTAAAKSVGINELIMIGITLKGSPFINTLSGYIPIPAVPKNMNEFRKAENKPAKGAAVTKSLLIILTNVVVCKFKKSKCKSLAFFAFISSNIYENSHIFAWSFNTDHLNF